MFSHALMYPLPGVDTSGALLPEDFAEISALCLEVGEATPAERRFLISNTIAYTAGRLASQAISTSLSNLASYGSPICFTRR